MKNTEKGILKSKRAVTPSKSFAKGFTSVMLSLTIFGNAIGFVSCIDRPQTPTETESSTSGQTESSSRGEESSQKDPNSEQSSTQDPNGDESSTQDPVGQDKITYEEFVDQYGEIANNFALDQIESVSFASDILSTSYVLNPEGDYIKSITVVNVVKTGETERQVKVTEINFIPAIHVDDIANDTISDKTALTMVSDTKLTFDAKEEYVDQATDIEDKIDEIIKAELGDFATNQEQYIQESFAPETVAELVRDEDFKNTVNEVLNKNFYEKMIQACVPFAFDSSKIESAEWVLEGENEITGVKFLLKYNKSSTETIYRFGNAKLASSVSIEDFIENKNIEIESTSVDYTFSYDPTIQGTRDDLVNAIFEAYGMSKECPEGTTRFFVDKGDTLDSIGEARRFIVVQISETGISEIWITIKQASSDEEYISKLNDSSNYRFTEESKIVEIDGEKLDYIPSTEAAALSLKTTAAEPKTIVVASKKKQKPEEYTRSL